VDEDDLEVGHEVLLRWAASRSLTGRFDRNDRPGATARQIQVAVRNRTVARDGRVNSVGDTGFEPVTSSV
jgi:hypothetical protein